MRPQRMAGMALVLACAGCATTSDPRQGGLFGYWGTGEQGYQRRLDHRRDELKTIEGQAAAEKAGAPELERNREALRAEIRKQQAEVETLDRELGDLRKQCSELQAATAAKSAEKDKVLQDMKAIQDQLDALRGDTTTVLAQKQAKIDALKAELKLLRERASLLTTL